MKIHLLSLLILTLLSCSTSKPKKSSTVIDSTRSICTMIVSIGPWVGGLSAEAEEFRGNTFHLKTKSFTLYDLKNFEVKDKNVEADPKVKNLAVKVQMEKNKDINWSNHEEWKIRLTLLESSNFHVVAGPVEANVVRDLKKQYALNEAVPGISLGVDVKGEPATVTVNCNKF